MFRETQANSLHVQKIPQQLRTFEGEKAFGMKLHAVQRPGLVPYAHDLVFLGPGADDKIGIMKCLAADDEAVIRVASKGLERPANTP